MTVAELMALLQRAIDDGAFKPEDEILVWANSYNGEMSLDIDDVTTDALGYVWIEASE